MPAGLRTTYHARKPDRLIWLHDRAFNRLEQLATADAKPAHLAAVHPLQGGGDRSVAFDHEKKVT